ncbi:MAG: MotA/TolQ/ExbB proton channel family protein [Pirellulales bacterium]|nr:MotA/TolQ/ExbB proton channel family protein [Pirellulales bacterium]
MLAKFIESQGWTFFTIFIFLSLAGVALVVWRFLLNMFARSDLEQTLVQLESQLESGGAQAAYDYCNSEDTMVAKVFTAMFEVGNQGRIAARTAIEKKIELELLPALNFLLPYILVLAKIAPMVGLLGTVIGMIGAFSKLGNAGAEGSDPNAVANEIGMALFTTAEGLIVAIPALFAYSYFRQQVQKMEIDLEKAGYAAMDLFPKVFKQRNG